MHPRWKPALTVGRCELKRRGGVACSNVRLLDLPPSVLTLILSHVGLQSLRSAHLVCRVFRAASLPCIRSVIVLPPDDEQKWHEQLQQMSGFTN